MPPTYFYGSYNRYTMTLTVQILCYKTHFFNTATTISYAFLPAINMRLLAVLIKICTSTGDPQSLTQLLKCTAHCPSALTLTSVQQAPSGCHFLHTEEFSDTSLLRTDFLDVKRHFVRVLFFCHLAHGNNM